MTVRFGTLAAALLLVSALLPLAAVARSAPPFHAVRHYGRAGAFDLTGSEFEGVAALCTRRGPSLRLWQEGWQDDCVSSPMAVTLCREPLLNRVLDLAQPGAHPGQWASIHANLSAWPIISCASGGTDLFVEIAFVDSEREWSADHRGLFAIARMATCEDPATDLGAVADGHGYNGNIITVEEIPPPESVVFERDDPLGGGSVFVVTLPEMPQYGSAGHEPAIYGYRLLYKSPIVALTSDPADYDGEVGHPERNEPLGIVPDGTREVRAFVRYSEPSVFIALQPVYGSEDAPIFSPVTSAHREGSRYIRVYPPNLVLVTELEPRAIGAGEPISASIVVTHEVPDALRDQIGRKLEVWSRLGQELAPGCVELATLRDLRCDECDDVSYDPLTATLRARRAELLRDDRVEITFTVDAGPGGPATCTNRVWATVEQHRYVQAVAVINHRGDRDALLRNVFPPVPPRPDFAAVLPLDVYVDPIPADNPIIDEPGLLSDPDRHFVVYGYDRSAVLKLTKDRAADTVAIWR